MGLTAGVSTPRAHPSLTLCKTHLRHVTIWEVTCKRGGLPCSVLFWSPRFGHRELAGLRGRLPCVTLVAVLSASPTQRAVVGYGHTQFDSFVRIISPLPSHPLSCWQTLFLCGSSCFHLLPYCPPLLPGAVLFTHTGRKTGILWCCPQQYIRMYP